MDNSQEPDASRLYNTTAIAQEKLLMHDIYEHKLEGNAKWEGLIATILKDKRGQERPRDGSPSILVRNI